jgi:adenylate kinase family enzyme
VRVVGGPGSGKSSLARVISIVLAVPVLELDSVVRLPGGRVVSLPAYRAACDRFLAGAEHGWVVDGDDLHEEGVRYADADVVLWLDVPRRVEVAHLVRRGLTDLLTDARAWHGSPESWRLLVGSGPTATLVRWAWREHAAERARYARLAASDPDRWVRLEGTRAARAWVAVLAPQRAGEPPAGGERAGAPPAAGPSTEPPWADDGPEVPHPRPSPGARTEPDEP